jgi:hypothetical protein
VTRLEKFGGREARVTGEWLTGQVERVWPDKNKKDLQKLINYFSFNAERKINQNK